nr:MAG TPA: hypothetical protein [Caudoviricetes sp.]
MGTIWGQNNEKYSKILENKIETVRKKSIKSVFV